MRRLLREDDPRELTYQKEGILMPKKPKKINFYLSKYRVKGTPNFWLFDKKGNQTASAEFRNIIRRKDY